MIVVFTLKLSFNWLIIWSASNTGVVFKSMMTMSDSLIVLFISLILGFNRIFLMPEGGVEFGSDYLNVPEIMLGSSVCLWSFLSSSMI